VTRSVILKSIRVAMERASTIRRQLTNHPTRARIETRTRIAKRTRRSRQAPALRSAQIRRKLNTRVPIAHQKISIPAVIVAQSTKAETKTRIASATRIRIDSAAILTRAAPADRNTKAGTKIATRINTRAPARHTKTSRRRRVTTRSRWM
jgi:hypothetical protein